jgi:hypothetical protein
MLSYMDEHLLIMSILGIDSKPTPFRQDNPDSVFKLRDPRSSIDCVGEGWSRLLALNAVKKV